MGEMKTAWVRFRAYKDRLEKTGTGAGGAGALTETDKSRMES